MADVILKYGPITPTMDWITCKGQPVHVDIQNDKSYVWCRVGENENVERKVRLVATGETYVGSYIRTVIYPNGTVWHLIEIF